MDFSFTWILHNSLYHDSANEHAGKKSFTCRSCFQIKKHRLSYFKSVWNILDILVIIISVVCVAFNVYRTVEVGDKLQDLLRDPNKFADFEALSYWETRFSNAIAIATFLAWIKV